MKSSPKPPAASAKLLNTTKQAISIPMPPPSNRTPRSNNKASQSLSWDYQQGCFKAMKDE